MFKTIHSELKMFPIVLYTFNLKPELPFQNSPNLKIGKMIYIEKLLLLNTEVISFSKLGEDLYKMLTVTLLT